MARTPAGFDELDNGTGKQVKRNNKALQAKSKTHTVLPMGDNVYTVVSGSSGTRYTVVMFTDLTGNCDCPWGTERHEALAENKGAVGCSHTLAVIRFIAIGQGRQISTWADVDTARKQKKHIVSTADGLTVTSAKSRGKRSRIQASFLALVDSLNGYKR
jgi:hypothetical protein